MWYLTEQYLNKLPSNNVHLIWGFPWPWITWNVLSICWIKIALNIKSTARYYYLMVFLNDKDWNHWIFLDHIITNVPSFFPDWCPFHKKPNSLIWKKWFLLTITLKMADQGRSDFYVVFTMNLCAFGLKTVVNKVAISNDTALTLSARVLRSYLKLICELISASYSLPNKKVSGAKDHGKNYIKLIWSAIFCVIVYFAGSYCTFNLNSQNQPGDSRSWESPEKADNVWRLFIQILLR